MQIVLKEDIEQRELNLNALKNVFEGEDEEFLIFAMDYLQDKLEEIILFLSNPEQMESLKKVNQNRKSNGNFYKLFNN